MRRQLSRGIRVPDDSPATELRIDAGNPAQLAYWARKFKSTPGAVADAVREVGPLAKHVRSRLRAQ